MSEEFQDRKACRTWLQQLLAIGGDADDITQGVLDGLVDSCEEETAPPSSSGFAVRIRRWVIRDEDLKLFAAIKDAIGPLAAAGFVLDSLPLAGIIAIVFALVQLLRNAYRTGAVVSVPQMQILTVLEHTKRPQTVDEILAQLPQCKDTPWDHEGVLKELQALKEVFTKNGKVAFVDVKSDGRWFLSGV